MNKLEAKQAFNFMKREGNRISRARKAVGSNVSEVSVYSCQGQLWQVSRFGKEITRLVHVDSGQVLFKG